MLSWDRARHFESPCRVRKEFDASRRSERYTRFRKILLGEKALRTRPAREKNARCSAKKRLARPLLDSFTTCESHIRSARTAVGDAARQMRFATGGAWAAARRNCARRGGGAHEDGGRHALAQRLRRAVRSCGSWCGVAIRAVSARCSTKSTDARELTRTPCRLDDRARCRDGTRKSACGRPAHVDAGRARVDTLRPEVGPRAHQRRLRAVQHGACESAGDVDAARPTTRTNTLAASAARGET
jgi:hypothetical protein